MNILTGNYCNQKAKLVIRPLVMKTQLDKKLIYVLYSLVNNGILLLSNFIIYINVLAPCKNLEVLIMKMDVF